MLSISDLRIALFQDLSGEMLEKLLPLVQERPFEEGQVIYRKGTPAEHFCILKSGRAVQEVDLGPSVTASIHTHVPGNCFGWSSLLPNFRYSTTVVCDTACDVLILSGSHLHELMESDYVFGYALYKRFSMALVERLDLRTEQCMKLFALHPELRHVVEQDAY